MNLLLPTAGALAALILAGLSIYTSYALALKALQKESIPVRWCGAGVICIWLLLALFHVLAPLHFFRLPWCMLGWVLPALLTWRFFDRNLESIQSLRHDVLAFRDRVRQAWASGDSWVYILATGFVLFLIAQEFITPPLDWDGLIHHLFLAGQWIQNGGLFSLDAPYPWYLYRYHPANGEALCAWFMLPFHSDRMVGFTNLFSWGLCVLAFYAICRHCRVGARNAALGGMLLGFTPACFAFASSSYVETSLLAELLCATLFTLRSFRRPTWPNVCLALASFGCALGTKLTAIPVVMAAFAFLALHLCLTREEPRTAQVGCALRTLHLKKLAAGVCLAVLVSAPWYIRAWAEQGSPTFPYPLKAGSLVLFHGSRDLEAALEDQHKLVAARRPPIRVVAGSQGASRFAEVVANRLSSHHDLVPFWAFPLTIGPLLAVLILLAPYGFLVFRRKEAALPSFFLLVSVLLFVWAYFQKDFVAVRYGWPQASCRFIMFPVSVLLLWTIPLLDEPGAKLPLWLRRVLLLVLALDFVLAIPEGFQAITMLYIQTTLVYLIVIGFVMWAAWTILRSEASSTRVPVIFLLLAIAAWGGVCTTRDESRYDFYADAFDLSDFPHKASRAWRHCDTPSQPRRIACTAGWQGTGHNWFWYPLLGRDLQNHVTYVPVTADGKMPDYQSVKSGPPKQADFATWLRGLLKQRIDTVVCLPPETIETTWAKEYPRAFAPVVQTEDVQVYELQPGGVQHLLAELPAGGVSR